MRSKINELYPGGRYEADQDGPTEAQNAEAPKKAAGRPELAHLIHQAAKGECAVQG
jgi:hypothetical protein